MYHLAWEVETLAELVAVRDRLAEAGALVGQSDHGASKSLYAHDPDGLEFEVMWQVPADLLTDGDGPVTKRLDIDAELTRYGADTTARKH
jgi:catechol-2,3-dioxygenase